ncbi:EAL domain-containing protein [Phreatobacter sp.]|uniref:EAL domain-containing protein n=1 Tax=Phreatobacter sp. TaxID=1966341 RepID=UPI003F6EBEC9
MTRSGSFFIALCMVAIAASAAAFAYLVGRVEPGASAAIGFGLMLAMVIGHLGSQRAADRTLAQARLDDLTRTTVGLAHDVEELSRRVERFETVAMEQARAATAPIASEIGELGVLVKQFAETLQVHEQAIERATGGPAAAIDALTEPATPETRTGTNAPPAPGAAALGRIDRDLRRRLEPQTVTEGVERLPGALAGLTRAEAIAVIDAAIAEERYDLYLQPVVILPQRRVRWYHASVRLRTADGLMLLPADYRSLAEDAGLMPRLDADMLARAIQIVRRLTVRNREVGLICDLSGASLADAAFSTELMTMLEAARPVAGSLVIGFRQDAVRAFSPLDVETLASLVDLGYRFVMDGVRDLRIEPRDLAEKGFRQVRIPADLMLARAAEAGASIHPADLSGLFARFGIELAVEGIETEAVVVDLLDYEVKLGQGALFSPPRPVRAEVLSGAEPAGLQVPPVQVPAPVRTPRTEQRADPRPQAALSQPSLGAAALAAGAVGGQTRDGRRQGIGQGLRALIRDRS